VLHEREELRDEAVEPLGAERAVVGRREGRAESSLPPGVDLVETTLALDLPELLHELEANVDERHDLSIRLVDPAPDLVEAVDLTHPPRVTAAIRATPLNS